jgi:ribonucleoside-diphosphate reductase alpha chain
VFKKVRALDLWRRMLTMLFETGHPWITFKDPCNIRSPQPCRRGAFLEPVHRDHAEHLGRRGRRLQSRLDQPANHIGKPDGLDRARLKRTVRTAMRMLDNVIDINFYTIPEARRSNLRHRPVGSRHDGLPGCAAGAAVPIASDAAVASPISAWKRSASTPSRPRSIWRPSAAAIRPSRARCGAAASCRSTPSSCWPRRARRARPGPLLDPGLDRPARAGAQKTGMRNSNTMAIAPTATISNICGVAQSIEPAYQNLYVKSNMSGDFTVVNAGLVRDLKALGLWDEVMISDLKYFDGSVGDRPGAGRSEGALCHRLRDRRRWLIEAAARRQKWIDQAQSLNLYIANPNGKKLDSSTAWPGTRVEDHLLPAGDERDACREVVFPTWP